jgi:hypothetical protein
MGAQEGDSITITGTVQETSGLTEIGAITDFVLNSSGNPLAAPVVSEPGVIDTSEAYEGVLVETDSVVVTYVDDATGEWQVARLDTCWVGHWAGYSYGPEVGHALNVTGIVGYSDGIYKVQPRYDEDIEDANSGVRPGDGGVIPKELTLAQNRPNPFSPATEIRYGLPKTGRVELTVYNVSGQVVKTLLDGDQPAGNWRVAWDGTDARGHRVADGVYFYSLKSGGRSLTKRMVVLR